MHIGFGLFLTLGIFPAISICSFIPFLPSIFWDFRSKKIKTKNREELKIYYDKLILSAKKVQGILLSNNNTCLHYLSPFLKNSF